MDRKAQLLVVERYFDQQQTAGNTISGPDCEIYVSLVFGVELYPAQTARVLEMQAALTPRTAKETVIKHVAKQQAAKKVIADAPVSEEEGSAILEKLFSGETLTPEETAKINALESQFESALSAA